MSLHHPLPWILGVALRLVAPGFAPLPLAAAEPGPIFPTPEAAVSALGQAVQATNRTLLASILGPAAGPLVNPDEVQGAAELAEFAEAFRAAHRLVPDSDTRRTLEVGPQAWPFPIPLVRVDGGWRFDTEAGLDELLNRRIGGNELDVLRVMRAYVEAQREYASRDRDGDQVLEYAQRIHSSPGRTDGLYWPPDLNGDISPLGPLVAYAQGEGYGRREVSPEDGLRPFHGYLFKLLARQGRHAPGGKHDYVINDNMIAGFAMVAWPAEYGESGVMTFIVNQQGRVFQRDLGKDTARIVRKLDRFDPDAAWQRSAD